MKKLPYIILIAIMACDSSPLNDDAIVIMVPNQEVSLKHPDLTKKAAVVYFDDRLYSGYLTSYHEDGSIQSKTGYLNGKLEGESIQYYANKQLREQRFYSENRKTGKHIGFWPSGQQKFEYYFERDLHIGELKEWYASGQPYRFFNYQKGKEDGSQKMWMEDGKIRANYVVKDGHRYGLIGLKNCKSVTDEEGIYTAIVY
ncbi:toxin-antitoxin system YwqK family antitoxin [Roseivirga sp. E12]|uniref:toxin-antitoxin system YwqK family antitoxin n=1 Tax=Roseivirga sp. E12 TaxID=2819237 RepID=UPI001ABC5379|nr:toxin-antitoxin system YwqK family antitoxin [Roseivirga sp. E12]MBO3700653.1 toxin-antitoxin system YwqK family antitoxin [Roseivirga sp. E12]